MPFVRISLTDSHDVPTAAAVGDAVHEAMVATIDVPGADRFQVISRHAPGEMVWDRTFLDVDRSERAVFVHITLALGRDDDKKRALYAKIVANIVRTTDVRASDILIFLTEVPRVNWSFGNGIAHYVPGPTR